MTLVADASAVVAALMDAGPVGAWAASALTDEDIRAPDLMPVEAADILRRAERAGEISAEMASLAHADLIDLPVELAPYEPHARRVWELRANLTCYDAWYVALAEALDVPLLTLDRGMARAPRLPCEMLLPPER